MGADDAFVQGIDVSKWQTTTPSLVGVRYLIARRGIGTKLDAYYDMHIANARKAAIITGSYWFNWGTLSVSDQVAAYARSEGDVDLHVIDWEGADGFTAAQTADFIRRYRALTGNRIGLYASESRFRDLGQDWDWIANYSREPIKHYDIWQYGPYHGADGNRFPGILSDLRAFAGITLTGEGPTEGTREMEIVTIKAEDWTPSTSATGTSNGVLRAAPVRTDPIVARIPLGVPVRTIAELIGPAGDNWRLTEYNGKPAYMLRTDLVPLVAGGDPATDQLLTNLIARVAPPPPVDTTPYSQAEIDAARAAGLADGILQEKADIRDRLGLS